MVVGWGVRLRVEERWRRGIYVPVWGRQRGDSRQRGDDRQRCDRSRPGVPPLAAIRGEQGCEDPPSLPLTERRCPPRAIDTSRLSASRTSHAPLSSASSRAPGGGRRAPAGRPADSTAAVIVQQIARQDTAPVGARARPQTPASGGKPWHPSRLWPQRWAAQARIGARARSGNRGRAHLALSPPPPPALDGHAPSGQDKKCPSAAPPPGATEDPWASANVCTLYISAHHKAVACGRGTHPTLEPGHPGRLGRQEEAALTPADPAHGKGRNPCHNGVGDTTPRIAGADE